MILTIALAITIQAQQPPQFDPITVKDRFSRTIQAYLSPPVPNKKLPIMVFIQGSGGQSIWQIRNNQVVGGLQNLLLGMVKGTFRVLVVEKPGVPFGFQPPRPGSAEGCPEEFLQEHTLERWTEAIDASVKQALKQPGIDPTSVVAIGHSEGGIVAASLAAKSIKVTQIAILAGGGPNQLVDLKKQFGQQIVEELKLNMSENPNSISKFILGHPIRRWSSFLKTSTLEECKKSNARIFIGQGDADKNVDPAGATFLFDSLKASRASLTMAMIHGGDHAFETNPKENNGTGFELMFSSVFVWAKAGRQ